MKGRCPWFQATARTWVIAGTDPAGGLLSPAWARFAWLAGKGGAGALWAHLYCLCGACSAELGPAGKVCWEEEAPRFEGNPLGPFLV